MAWLILYFAALEALSLWAKSFFMGFSEIENEFLVGKLKCREINSNNAVFQSLVSNNGSS